MIEIHILLAEVEIGPFTEKQVRQYLAEGLITASDPARPVGMSDWEPVEVVLSRLPRPSLMATAPPAVPEPSSVAFNPPPFEPLAPAVEIQHDLPRTIASPTATRGLPILNPAAPKNKSKPAKIVVQPILPLTSAPSGKKKEPPPKPSSGLQPSPTADLPTAPTPSVLAAPPVLPATKIESPAHAKKQVESKPAPVNLPPQLMQASHPYRPRARGGARRRSDATRRS